MNIILLLFMTNLLYIFNSSPSYSPSDDNDGDVLCWEEQRWRDEDWCEAEECRNTVELTPPDLGAFLYEQNPEYEKYMYVGLVYKLASDFKSKWTENHLKFKVRPSIQYFLISKISTFILNTEACIQISMFEISVYCNRGVELSKQQLTEWYTQRSFEIERFSRMVDFSLTLVRLGMERGVQVLVFTNQTCFVVF